MKRPTARYATNTPLMKLKPQAKSLFDPWVALVRRTRRKVKIPIARGLIDVASAAPMKTGTGMGILTELAHVFFFFCLAASLAAVHLANFNVRFIFYQLSAIVAAYGFFWHLPLKVLLKSYRKFAKLSIIDF
jgi:hypothetical protein